MDVYNLSEEQVIEELQKFGVSVIMKPMALMPDEVYSIDSFMPSPRYEMDIYEALSIFQNRGSYMIIREKE